VRTGQVVVVAGHEGSGKSTFCANWYWRTDQSALYLAQEDPFSTIQILVALATNQPKANIRPEDSDYWADRLKGKRANADFVTEAQTIEKLEARLIALHEWLMGPIDLVFIDSLFDLEVEGINYMDNAYWATVLPALKQMALKHDVAIICQHHANRGDTKVPGIDPLTLKSLLFGGSREAAHVWGIYHDEGNRHMYVQVLKQRNGRAGPGGGLYATLDWQPEEGVLWSR
jgi:ABC-type cobalamin/Fe3+-siderophores transport system ATPase subunit